MADFIGIGEMTTYKILVRMFPNATIKPQTRLASIVKNIDLSQRQQKESLDFLMHNNNQDIAIRVQGPTHKGRHITNADRHQRDILESNNIKVVDLAMSDCPELFKNNFNYLSFWEVCNAFKENNIKP